MSEEVEVRQVDQDQINEFGRLNNRLLELRADMKQLKQDAEKLEDASTELMMAEGGRVMLLIGEAFVQVTEDFATEYCDKKQGEITAKMETHTKEEADIVKRSESLKKELYARFGDSINLEQ
jgi:prefoldin subunit 4